MTTSLAEAMRAGPLGLRRIPGATLGPYEVVSELGRGGFGAVFRARRRDAPGAPEVALKVLLDAGGATRARRFEREAALARELRHPGIVPVLDAGERDGLLFIVFELVEGTTLDRAAEGAPVDRVLALVLEVAHAVAHAHARGVVHRDLKPANVLVRARDGRALVTDFGLARDLALDSSLTNTGALLGTPAYMAPEQLTGGPPAPTMDVFALGALLHEALTGETPFLRENLALRFGAIAAGDLAPPSAARAGVSTAVDAVVRRALALQPAERFPDAGAFAAALEAAGEGRAPEPARRRRPALVGALLAGALAVVVVGLVVARRPGATVEPAAPAPTAAPHEAPAPLDDPAARARAALARGAGATATSLARITAAAGLADPALAWDLESAARAALRDLAERAAAPAADEARAVLAAIEAARALDPARTGPATDVVVLHEDRLAARDDAPPAVRWLVAARRRRAGLAYDRRALRLHETFGPLSTHDERLQKNLDAAGDDSAKLAHAYRGFTHATRRDKSPAVAFEAEEEMAARCLPQERRSWCTTRGLTLDALGRQDEAWPLLDEAAALADATGQDEAIGDARFWRGSVLVKHGRHAEAVADLRRSIEHAHRAGTLRNGWSHYHLARALHGVGEHEAALAACADARRIGEVPANRVREVEEAARAALGTR
ncbi:MAG: serine/threonine protein kinase [Planctomycetes bacterium]|nr:serine/threonine protein kinase [Planctomycetota bacterium]